MITKIGLSVVALAISIVPVAAQEYKAGPLQVENPWARATPTGAKVGGGYLTIKNDGTAPDKLVGGSSPIAQSVELHEMNSENGVMKMRALPNGLQINPGQTVTLKPGGYHIMFVGLNKSLKQGDHVPVTLDFANAGKVNVEFTVEGMGAMQSSGHDMSNMPGMSGGH
jgi:copper(I)-binding protein